MYFLLIFSSLLPLVFPGIVVNTKYGKIDGFAHETDSGFKSDVFLGIPYAKPPVNELRFSKPIPPEPWDTAKAHNYGSFCAGHLAFFQMANASEDCLYMNIARPSQPSEDPKGYPVMFWIHGGAFIVGSADMYHNLTVVETLVSRGIIFVSINYRLGPFGFLTFDEKYPGNYGLWDQVQGLKFLREIIEDFGGNPDSVTVFGESAGGASVSWLTVNQESKKLFKNAIMMSGSHHCIHAQSEDTRPSSKKVLQKFGNDFEKVKNAKTEDILMLFPDVLRSDSVNFNHWSPVLDGNYVVADTHEEADLQAPKKSVLIGLVSQENAKFVLTFPNIPEQDAKIMPMSRAKAAAFDRQRFESSIKQLLSQDGAYGAYTEDAIEKVIKFYSKQAKNYSKKPFLNAFTQLLSDLNFNVAALREARSKTEAGFDVYFYLYDFYALENELFEGTAHVDELATIFGAIPYVEADQEALGFEENKKAFIALLTSFATGNVPEIDGKVLQKVEKNKIRYVKLSNSGVSFHDNLWKDRLDFWDQQAQEYGFDWVTGGWISGSSRHKIEL